MSSDGYINVLSLDGGGIKGLYTARVLEYLESTFQIKTASCFDLICGTSTGGLIALGLASDHTAESIANFYDKKGKKIFPYTTWLSRQVHFLKSLVIVSKYSGSILKNELEGFFGNGNLMKNLRTDVCIPSYNVSTGKSVIFKKSSNPAYHLDSELNVIDVALATSAAPTFFPMHEIQNAGARTGRYIDGGIWANDPSLCGLLEIIRENKAGEQKKIRILSISAIPTSPAISKPLYRRYSMLNWGAKLFDFGAQAQSELNSNLMRWLEDIHQIEYYRIIPKIISQDQLKRISMDNASDKSIDVYNNLGRQSGVDFLKDFPEAAKLFFNNSKP